MRKTKTPIRVFVFLTRRPGFEPELMAFPPKTGRLGIEPRLKASKASVLPLDDLPVLSTSFRWDRRRPLSGPYPDESRELDDPRIFFFLNLPQRGGENYFFFLFKVCFKIGTLTRGSLFLFAIVIFMNSLNIISNNFIFFKGH